MADNENAGNNPAGGEWQEIIDNLKKAVTNLMKLEVKTIVEGDQSKEIQTTIDLVQGDITNSIDQAFLEDPELQSIREFHTAQVEKGQAIIKGNIEGIVKLYNELSQLG